ncbi:MAG TPA: protein-glutamate O-methyltransferase [Polyangiales bacterium]|nr:protein-glutamate O-methyltransferase [Polyangiales bacterium]
MDEAPTQKRLWPVPEVRALRMRDFHMLRKLVYDEAGIHLPDAKRVLVEARLARRLRELGLRSYEQYCELVLDSANSEERVRMLDCITTNETHFFREPKHFQFLTERVFPEWAAQARARTRGKRLRVWSAACSTGEEPYSLAMCLLTAFPREAGWEIELYASDISTRALDHAVDATWPIDKAQEIPERERKRYMLRGIGAREGELRCGPELRELVRFVRINLNQPPIPLPGQFDLIFCRNVLIYFDAGSRARVITGLLERLHARGHLFVGHSETLHNVTRKLTLIAPSVYVPSSAGTQPEALSDEEAR